MQTTSLGNAKANQNKGPFMLPNLPFAQNALEPAMSANLLDFHHKKHHAAYVTNLNNLINNSEYQDQSLEQIIMATVGKDDKLAIFNNAAQIWNHSFFWHCMKPNGGKEPYGKIADKITADFGSYANFKDQFKNIGVSQFGSGWVWLVLENDKLKIIKTLNADMPLVHNQKAILTCDVWEHAYYLDYQNRRADFIVTFLDELVNWDFANSNLESL